MQSSKIDKDRIATALLETGALMMSSGASTGRIRVTLRRIASSLGYNLELMVTHRALILTLIDDEGEHSFSKIKRISPHGVNFLVVSGISHMSWNVAQEKWNVDMIMDELERLKNLNHYNRWLVLSLVGAADTAFCYLFGGGYAEMIIAFVATFAGLFVRQESMKRNLNPYICVYLAAFMASLISGLSFSFDFCTKPETAFATSVLFLVPGVPLVNSITDLIEGNIQNGITRGVNGLFIAFSIALGLLTAKMIFNI